MEAASTTSSDRSVEQLCDVGGRGQLAAPRGSVEEAHDALDDGDVRPLAAMAHERIHQLGPAQERIEIAPRPPRRERVVARIDVVGPDLEPLDDVPASSQRADDAARDRGLPGARAGARNDDARDQAPPPRHAYKGVRPLSMHPGATLGSGTHVACLTPLCARATTRCPAGRGCRHPSGASASPPRTPGRRPRSARVARRGRSARRAGSPGGRAGLRSRRPARSSPT